MTPVWTDRRPMRTLQPATRAIAFGRHIPITQIARRLELTLRRKLREYLPAFASISREPPPVAAAPPQPLFPPRAPHCHQDGDQLVFTFLNRVVSMSRKSMNWRPDLSPPDAQLWRMHLHYMEYLEPLPHTIFGELVRDWIAQSPYAEADAWRDAWNSYALSIRTVIWMQQIAHRAGSLGQPLVAAMHRSLAQQLRFLEGNLETDIGGNHLIKNIAALLWASAFFAGPETERWRQIGLQHLRTALPRQTLADGMHYERSPSYHCQVLADLLTCRQALGCDPLDGMLDAALHRMAQATADLVHPDGAVPQFNDAGLTMAYAPTICLNAYARLFGNRPQQRALFAMRDAGYYGLHTGGSALFIDCGRIAPDDLPAHGHGDVLSFEWSVAGRRIIVDQGVHEYSAGQKRQAARTAASHSTLCFDGADQADFFGAFRCGQRPDVQIRTWEPGSNRFILEGAHTGFIHLPGHPIHVRRFEATPDTIVIHDRIEGSPAAHASIAFLLHPDVDVSTTGPSASLSTPDCRIAMFCTEPIAVEPAVWWPDLGKEVPARRLRIHLPPGQRALTTTLRVVRNCIT